MAYCLITRNLLFDLIKDLFFIVTLPTNCFFFSVECEYICFILNIGSVKKKRKEQIHEIRRPVKIVRPLSINLNVFYFAALCFPRFLHLTEMRNERTPHSYFVRIFLIKLAGSSAFNQDTVTQSPVRVFENKLCQRELKNTSPRDARSPEKRLRDDNVAFYVFTHLLKIRCWLGHRQDPRGGF